MKISIRDNFPRLIFGALTLIWAIQTFYNRTLDISLLLSLVAIWATVYEINRDNTVLLHVRECSASGRMNVRENKGEYYRHFTIVLQNKGISLFRPFVALQFTKPGGGGSVNMPLRLAKEHSTDDLSQFARGMLAVFEWKSHEMNPGDAECLAQLKDLESQDARITVFSQNYIAKTFRLGGRLDRIKSSWNRLAYKINRTLDKKIITPDGRELSKLGDLMPMFLIVGNEMQRFIRMLNEDRRLPAEMKG